MNENKSLYVYIGDKKVGTLAVTANHMVAFEYDNEWIATGYSISPFSLPLEKGVFIPKKYETFEGLFGVFADSLPDGWGRLLVDRMLLKNHINYEEVEALGRLAIVADSGMGALTYWPKSNMVAENSDLTLDQIAKECKNLLESKHSNNLDELFWLGGSSGGARPKIFYNIDGEEWIVKFPSSYDREDIGKQEYDYSVCAKKCGIIMPETKLLASELNSGYFAVKRFDRENHARIHMVSVSALLETSHRIPNLDYTLLMNLTMKLTRSFSEIEKLYRQMCFNVFAHNRDDHSKNFSYIYKDDRWQLSPAYDLTYSNSIGGEHATTVNGNGINPGMKEVLAVADYIKFDYKKAKCIAEEIQDIVYSELGEWIEN